MNPVVEARMVYDRETCLRSFEEDLYLHLAHGYVISTPRLFVMGRPVRREADYENIIDPAHMFEDPDAWWVYLASGTLRDILDAEPFPLPYFGWEIKNEPRFHERQALLNHAKSSTTVHFGSCARLQGRQNSESAQGPKAPGPTIA